MAMDKATEPSRWVRCGRHKCNENVWSFSLDVMCGLDMNLRVGFDSLCRDVLMHRSAMAHIIHFGELQTISLSLVLPYTNND